MEKIRIDLFLYKNNYCESRNKAQELIKKNCIKINGQVVNKLNLLVSDHDCIEIIKDLPFVSRAGEKLWHAIKTFKIDLSNKIVLDIGASTGGFSDCCLQHHARKIYAVDVGSEQLHRSLKNNPQIIDLSPLNIKDLKQELIDDEIDVVVSDLSFISSKYMFEAINHIKLNKNVIIISLIKPQFELTKEIINQQKAKVKLNKYHEQAINSVITYAKKNNFKCVSVIESPITGAKMQNKEFLGLFKYA